jgi:hypothetical protein
MGLFGGDSYSKSDESSLGHAGPSKRLSFFVLCSESMVFERLEKASVGRLVC